MNHNIKHISIPTPCNQNWADMDVVDHGKFCQSCEKTVVDFTKLTNEQVIQAFSLSGNTCGRFAVGQLENINASLSIQHSKRFSWKKFSLAAAFIGFVPFIKAQAQVKAGVESVPIPAKKTLATIDTSVAFRNVSVTVIDPYDGGPLIGAMVRINGLAKVLVTGVDGKITLKVPHSSYSTGVVSYIGYKPVPFNVGFFDEGPCQVTMLSLGTTLGGPQINYVKPPFYKRVWYTVKKPFKAMFAANKKATPPA